MKLKFLIINITIFFFTSSYSQVEQCGTMQNLDEQIKKDPSLKSRLIEIENQNNKWIEKNGLGFKKHLEIENYEKFENTFKSNLNTNALCGYDNSYFTTVVAPTTLNNIVSPNPNCTYAGEYVRVNNLIAGRTYRISTIGLNNFDTVISIFLAGGGNPIAYNDDWNGSSQSEIYFTPFVSGNYDILVDQFGCVSNQICAALQIELWYNPRPIITIPVVVHVFHKGESIGTGNNISIQQIQSQIDVLNQDFRRLNTNVLLSPAPFRGTSTDPLIQFCLAQQKPDGSLTDGIMRYLEPSQQDYANLIIPNVGNLPLNLQCLNLITLKWIESSTIWNRDKYLNIWVSDKLNQLPSPNGLGCGFENSLLGLAQFPGENGQPSPIFPDYSLTDGVWVTTTAFGTTGNVTAPYNLGRTATHEVGHWLNLKHIWGDDTTASPSLPECSIDDLVIDTPLQSTSSQGCNTFPFTDSCTNLFPGIMYMNHMDYSLDDCRSIFTWGQSARMDATLFNQRVSLLTSQGCQPGVLTLNDFETKEIKLYPNPTSSKVFFDNTSAKFNELTIQNYLGQVVNKVNFIEFQANQEIDLSNFSTGVYILNFKSEKLNKSIKIVKQ